MNYFFAPTFFEAGGILSLSAEEARHAAKVLRLAPGDELAVINGKGQLAQTKIMALSEKGLQADIHTVYAEPEPGYQITIALAILKKKERMEWFVEKAVELGAHRIILFQADHTEKYAKADEERMQRIAITALKQSGNLWLPQITTNAKFSEILKAKEDGLRFIAHCYDGDKELLSRAVRPDESITVLIGPEGDFSTKEVEMSVAEGFIPVSLGSLRLRAETAALAALMTMQIANQ